ncbi:TetR/AcrR family transcriptional regulator [Streptomyces longwoodensis]|uniref:TetR/AcrR family transcriptional regulator n=1 Tax=Streptomyces lasalocidi TaxID=324833 RepID=A0A4U5WLD3_STRLS|nr:MULTISPECIES: TetR/AcrR family transcriptional regulator [Streptomyces]MCX4994330.1 TetR/AcrR family transcriptional regulator [Streptomyces longwoodensis]TKT01336.1 TetR/AcrR family transcriptional regulator [Streptomyces lasalocidi]WRY89187.1 TetR/AcrR family transcriptional regulator [Streptomyces longwoodensis]WUC59325.1 TetR/AcrR family transcriptional regulator [Streptomyces longwoodensis]WUC72836.1 TetR/AcrR family transcriptional regulator [Streptomyces longwoodensis]
MTSRRPYHHGDLRAELLSRAEETLRERGAGALSLRELARDIGVSPAAPSRHFRTKQALLDALALTGFERLADVIAASQRDAGASFPERLDAAARAYVDFAMTNAALLDLMFSVKHSADAAEVLGGAVHRWSDLLLGVIAEGQREGEVRAGPMERVALPVFAALHGYAGLAVSGFLPPEAMTDGLTDVIASTLRGCAPDPAQG